VLYFGLLRYIVQLKGANYYFSQNRLKHVKIVDFTDVFDYKIALKYL